MDDDPEARDLRSVSRRIYETPPPAHPEAVNGRVWGTQWGCYEFMMGQVGPGSRTIETGAGISTALFAAWGCDHLTVVPFPDEADAITSYCSDMGIDTSGVTFDLRPSEVALPQLAGTGARDLVFIDGGHGFPTPVIDWFYGAGLLRRGGVVVFDDVQLPQVGVFLDTFVERDIRWQRLAGSRKWRAYRRMSEGSLSEGQWEQPFYTVPPPSLAKRWERTLKDAVPLEVRKKLRSYL